MTITWQRLEEIINAVRAETDLPRKAFEDTYEDGWIDGCNAVLTALYEELHPEEGE
jgi:hypothetical protein